MHLTHLAGRILQRTPVLSASLTRPGAALGLLSLPALQPRRPDAVHLVFADPLLDAECANQMALAARPFLGPGSGTFVVVAPTERVGLLLSARGLPTLTAHPFCLYDDRVTAPATEGQGALYVGPLADRRTVALLAGIADLTVVLTEAQGPRAVPADHLAALLPLARFAPEWGADAASIARRVAAAAVVVVADQADRVGATAAALMLGRPVVSVGAADGRTAFLTATNAHQPEETPEAVARAVETLLARAPAAESIRADFARHIGWERQRLLAGLSGVLSTINTIDPLLGLPYESVPVAPLLAALGPAPAVLRRTPGVEAPDKRLIFLVGRARTGTHVIRDVIAKQPDYMNFGEVLNPHVMRYLPHHFANFLRASLFAMPDLSLSQDDAAAVLNDYWRYLSGLGDGRVGLVDLKDVGLSMMNWNIPLSAARSRMLTSVRDNGFPVIRMRRRNLLAQIASVDLANKTHVWVSRGTDPGPSTTTIRLNPAGIVAQLDAAERQESELDRHFTDYPALATCYYEDLVADGQVTPGFVNVVEGLTGVRFMASTLVGTNKLAPKLTDLIENYAEVAAAVQNSRHAGLLLLP